MQRRPEPEYMDLDAEAAAYADADFAEVNGAFAQRLVALAVDIPQTDVVALDLGTGPADIPRRVAALRPGWRIVAVDAAAAMLALAPKAASVSLVRADASRCPFSDAALDVVFSNSILHHLPDPTDFWREVARVARRGALVLLRDLARPDTEQAARDIVERYAGTESELLQEEYYRSLLAAFTPDEVRAQLREAGVQGLRAEMVTDRHMDVCGRVA